MRGPYHMRYMICRNCGNERYKEFEGALDTTVVVVDILAMDHDKECSKCGFPMQLTRDYP